MQIECHFKKNCVCDENADREEDNSFTCQETLTKKQIFQKAMENAIINSLGALSKSLWHKILRCSRPQRNAQNDSMCQALIAAKWTSVESERSFSVGGRGGFATKVRSYLGEKALSSLVFLKMFFKKQADIHVADILTFSVGGGFATKVRSRLGDKALFLCFFLLKVYFSSKLINKYWKL